MTTLARNIFFDTYTNDAAFRQWVSDVGDSLVAMGLVRTSNTGQYNRTSGGRPALAAGEQLAGYEIFRFDDALQATHPIFVKLEWGVIVDRNTNYSSVYHYTSPVIYLTVGTATDGAGTLTGAITTTRIRLVGGTAQQSAIGSSSGGSAPTATSPCLFSGSTDRSFVGMALGAGTPAQPTWTGISTLVRYASFPAFLIIERTRDSNGQPNGNGFYVATCKWPIPGSSTAPTTFVPTIQMMSFTGSGMGILDSDWPFAIPGRGFGTTGTGTEVSFFPLPLASPAASQALGLVGAYKADATFGMQASLMVMGEMHNYISLGSIGGTADNDGARGQISNSYTNLIALMRWE